MVSVIITLALRGLAPSVFTSFSMVSTVMTAAIMTSVSIDETVPASIQTHACCNAWHSWLACLLGRMTILPVSAVRGGYLAPWGI